MAKTFRVELSMREAPADAQARAATALKDPARAVGLRLRSRDAGELAYRAPVGFPFLVNLWHHLNREQMTVRFEPGAGGGTQVTISGAVSGGNQGAAADPEHWLEALGASPVE
ncbi:MAG TPA: hypothetical protein VKG38_10015 [Solirubrobacteraceae bacterium]|nr:hypothetical protein [Solirubrobacteraceae bacterium]